jgi:hypothetical protein
MSGISRLGWRFLFARGLYWLSLRLVRLALAITPPACPPVVRIAGRTYE